MTNDEIWLYKKAQEGGGGGTSILSGTTDPVSSQGSNGQIYLEYIDGSSITEDYTYDQELNWSCKNDYYVHDISQLLSTHSTAFYKTVAGGAIAVEWHYGSYYGPILISTNQNYVKYTRNENPNYSIVIDGTTWYMSSSDYWNGTEDNNATIPLFATNYNPTSNVLQAIKDILLASGFINGNYDNSVNKAYLKVNSTWQNLIGSCIDDVGNTTEADVPIDMSNITVYKANSMSALSDDTDTILNWNNGSQITLTIAYTIPIDVTNISKLKYDLQTRSCWGNGQQALKPNWYVQIGIMSTFPTTYLDGAYSDLSFVAGNYFPNSNTDYGTQEIDVSSLSGNYYFVINAHGWNASIKNLRSE